MSKNLPPNSTQKQNYFKVTKNNAANLAHILLLSLMAGLLCSPSSKSLISPFKPSKKTTLIFLLFSLFSINFFFFFNFHHYPSLSFNLHSSTTHPLHVTTTTTNPTYFSDPKTPLQKPWPILPSYLPWTPPSPTPSCEAFFGNGFYKTSTVYPRSSLNSSWFRCRFNPTLRSSVCEAGRVLMDPDRIRMSSGGERIQEVIGRSDDDELPSYQDGAFRLLVPPRKGGGGGGGGGDGGGVGRRKGAVSKEFVDEFLPQGEVWRHSMRELFLSMEVVEDDHEFRCSQWIEEPTLLLTRFEYANVFHTYTDWYSAYVSSRVTGLPTRPHVIFLDGHSKTQLEETWEALFSSVKFAKNFTAPVCFRHAVFVPLGYETAWFKGLSQSIDCHGAPAKSLWSNPDDHKTARLSEFGEMIKAAFDFPVDMPRTPKPSEYNVLFVRREDYLAHPRHGGKVESRLSNEQEVFHTLKLWASNYSQCHINLVNGLFGHMPMREQIRAIEDASVIIGAHGAGLTHVVSALPKTVIFEIISSQFRRPHFQLISQWKGLEYHAMHLSGSSANPSKVIERFKRIMKNIGC